MGKQSLVALDTNHIHEFVFETDMLQEIRGASSILDKLNRKTMGEIAGQGEFGGEMVYANGGSGLAYIKGDAAAAERYGKLVQETYRQQTNGGATITYAVIELPEEKNGQDDDTIAERELLRYRLAREKNNTSPIVSQPSHSILRPCSACGKRYAEIFDISEKNDLASRGNRYCGVCREKREEDDRIKRGIRGIIKKNISKGERTPYTWARVLNGLPSGFLIPDDTERPSDFNEFQGITGEKAYLALIYADGNNMGKLLDDQKKLPLVRDTAKAIDDAIFVAMSAAVSEHLKVVPRNGDTPPRFPFDMLLIGGDDAVIVTPAAQALDVACTLAKTFHEFTRENVPDRVGRTLSIGVVFAPVKYPFGLLRDLAYDTLKYAKKEGANRRHPESAHGKDTFINFMSVTGSLSLNFGTIYKSLQDKHISDGAREAALYATLRPYTVEELEILLAAIREGKRKGLGRTKLHQLREAVLKLNLSTSVYEGMAILNSWRQDQRDIVMKYFLQLSNHFQVAHRDAEKPETQFPRITFPWFVDGDDTYRSPLLDFVDLYDFVAQEEVEDAN